MKKLSILLPAVLSAAILTGCWDQDIYEKIGFILNIGIDLDNDGTPKYTFSYPLISQSTKGGGDGGGGGPSGQTGPVSGVSVLETDLLREAREIDRLSSPLQVSGGKVQAFIFGKSFAMSKDISDYLELYERDPQSSAQARVIIVDGNASELITRGVRLEDKPRLGIYINELLKRDSAAGYCPDTTVVEYDIINTTPGISPIVPMIRLKGDDVEVAGTALIDRDKMTGQIDTNETACLFLAMGKAKKTYLLFDLPKDIQSEKKKGLVFVRKLRTKSRLQLKDGEPSITFDIRADVIIEEYMWGNLMDQGYRNKLEASLNESIKTCLDDVFNKLREAKCDAFGLGDKVRARYYDYWKSIGELDGWKKIYSTMKASFNVDSKIVRFGEIQ